MGAGEQLTADQINEMWKSGFCSKMVEFARTTAAGPLGAMSRISYLEVHIHHCRDCYHATVMKNVEANAAQLMGGEATRAFQQGQDITKLEGFDDAMKSAVRGLLKSQYATDQFFKWWRKVVSRGDYHGQETD